jgi:uncharacterized membrane protein HdeD (DUF308 family)
VELESRWEEGEQILASIWKAMALRSVLAVAFGVVLLIWPDVGLTAFIILFGVFALVSGLAIVFAAIVAPIQAGKRPWLILEGLAGVAVGVVVLVWPDLSALALLYAIAAWAIAAGVVEMATAFVLPISSERALLLWLTGLLSVAFGVIMFARPGAGALALVTLVAAFAIVIGVMQFAYALELRSIAKKLSRRPPPGTTTKPVAHG